MDVIFGRFKEKKINVVTALREAADAIAFQPLRSRAFWKPWPQLLPIRTPGNFNIFCIAT